MISCQAIILLSGCELTLYVPNLKTALKWCLDSILMRDKYCRKLASRLRGSVISTSLRGDQMETGMSLDTLQQCFISFNSLPRTYFTCVSGSYFKVHFKVPSSLFKRLFQVTTLDWRSCIGPFYQWTQVNSTKPVWPRYDCSFVLFPSCRRLQEEEQQLRTSSLPAIPNPFPELCSPASSPVLSPGSLPPGEPSAGNYVSQTPQKKHCRNFPETLTFQEFTEKKKNKTV